MTHRFGKVKDTQGQGQGPMDAAEEWCWAMLWRSRRVYVRLLKSGDPRRRQCIQIARAMGAVERAMVWWRSIVRIRRPGLTP